MLRCLIPCVLLACTVRAGWLSNTNPLPPLRVRSLTVINAFSVRGISTLSYVETSNGVFRGDGSALTGVVHDEEDPRWAAEKDQYHRLDGATVTGPVTNLESLFVRELQVWNDEYGYERLIDIDQPSMNWLHFFPDSQSRSVRIQQWDILDETGGIVLPRLTNTLDARFIRGTITNTYPGGRCVLETVDGSNFYFQVVP